MSEKKEGWMRIIVGIVTGIILHLWGALVCVLVLINFLVTVCTGKRNRGLAEFCEMWNTQLYAFLRYMTFMSNYRPFPFNPLDKNISKFEARQG
jgi:hypothetical protein